MYIFLFPEALRYFFLSFSLVAFGELYTKGVLVYNK